MLILIGIVAALVLYFGLFYAAPEADKEVRWRAGRSYELSLLRTFFPGLLAFFALDGAIFHSGLYESVSRPRSRAGQIARVARLERQRPPGNAKEILVVGDSRIGRGFSEELANAMTVGQNVRFFKRALSGSNPRVWYYFLREIDPSAGRYGAIILPVKFDASEILEVEPDSSGAPLVDGVWDIVQAAPLLRYGDAWRFGSSFREWNNQCRAFTACCLRGTAFQADIVDFIEHPAERIGNIRGTSVDRGPLSADADAMKRYRASRNATGSTSDPVAGKTEFPGGLAKNKDATAASTPTLPKRDWSNKPYDWTRRIVERYAGSHTAIVFVTLPRDPFARAKDRKRRDFEFATFLAKKNAIMLDDREFQFLEKPEYFKDNYHLNSRGRREFTQRLADEALRQLTSRDVDPAVSNR